VQINNFITPILRTTAKTQNCYSGDRNVLEVESRYLKQNLRNLEDLTFTSEKS